MIELGFVRLRRNYTIFELRDLIKNAVANTDFEDESIDDDVFIDEEGYIFSRNWRMFIGKKILLTFCKNMKGRITVIHVRYRDVSNDRLMSLVSSIEELTGGKFHGAI